jgi:hypothetical protein
MQLVVVKAKGNSKRLDGHSALHWSKKNPKLSWSCFEKKLIKIIKRNKHQTKKII